jgi:tryptophan-rich sensory protein
MNESTPLSRTQQVIGLIVSIAICFAAAGLGSLATTPKIPNWYADLAKPSWNPPAWIFGPVWTTLYLFMAIAAWLVWRQGGFRNARGPLLLFGVQLVLNTLWSFLFFGLQNPGAAAIEIVVLWVAILATLLAFAKRSTTAASLLAPYLAWVSFAAVLNFTIWRMNS